MSHSRTYRWHCPPPIGQNEGEDKTANRSRSGSRQEKKMIIECRSSVYCATLLSVLFAAIFAISGCANPEKTKVAHVEKGEVYLKDEKFQEASLEFRNA